MTTAIEHPSDPASRQARHPAQSGFPPLLPSALVLTCAVVLVLALSAAKDAPISKPAKAVHGLLMKKHKLKQAHEVELACRQADCKCVVSAARAGLDVEAHAEVRELLDAGTSACKSPGALSGLRTELLVRRADDAGKGEAARVLASEPENPNALYALGLLEYRAGHGPQADQYAARALTNGRGSAAQTLRGLIAFSMNNLALATTAFQSILASEPDDVDAHYNLALAYQLQHDYGQARSGYLAVTRIDPSNKDARYNLAILANSIGATQEAQHHLEKLREIAPADERVVRLRAILASAHRDPLPSVNAAAAATLEP